MPIVFQYNSSQQNRYSKTSIKQNQMIRPCIAPIKPKHLKQSDLTLEDPLPPSTRQYTLTTIRSPKTSINEEYVSANNSTFPPISLHSQTERPNRIFQQRDLRGDKNEEKMYCRLKEQMERQFEVLRRENGKEIKGMRGEIERMGVGVKELKERLSEEGVRGLVMKTVMGLVEGKGMEGERQRQKENARLQGRFQAVDEKLLKIQQYYIQNMEKAYMQVKEITHCMQIFSSKLQYLQHQNLFRLSSIEQRLFSLQTPPSPHPPHHSKISLSHNLHLSKINIQQPQSIVSKYELSGIKSLSKENKQGSFIDKLDVIDASSQMIVIGDEGDVTDWQGVPVVDRAGNMVVVNLRQMKRMLGQQGEERKE